MDKYYEEIRRTINDLNLYCGVMAFFHKRELEKQVVQIRIKLGLPL